MTSSKLSSPHNEVLDADLRIELLLALTRVALDYAHANTLRTNVMQKDPKFRGTRRPV